MFGKLFGRGAKKLKANQPINPQVSTEVQQAQANLAQIQELTKRQQQIASSTPDFDARNRAMLERMNQYRGR